MGVPWGVGVVMIRPESRSVKLSGCKSRQLVLSNQFARLAEGPLTVAMLDFDTLIMGH